MNFGMGTVWILWITAKLDSFHEIAINEKFTEKYAGNR